MTNRKSKISVKEALKQTWGFKPYRELFCIELFSWLAVQVIIKFIIMCACNVFIISLGKEILHFIFNMI